MAESHLFLASLRHRRLLPAIAFAVLSSACAGSRAPAYTAPSPEEKARADSIRFPYTAADIHFMTGMISHHAQAIEMAKWAPTHGASDAVQRLSARVVNAQTDEIKTMQTWLGDRSQPVPVADPKGMKMTMGGMTHTMLMPGMLSEAQMKELNAARGVEFDRLFLTFMIQHHRGAVSMVNELFSHHGAGQDEIVFRFASDVAVDQETEINRMMEMLLTLP